jgi:hypothetical protein
MKMDKKGQVWLVFGQLSAFSMRPCLPVHQTETSHPAIQNDFVTVKVIKLSWGWTTRSGIELAAFYENGTTTKIKRSRYF